MSFTSFIYSLSSSLSLSSLVSLPLSIFFFLSILIYSYLIFLPHCLSRYVSLSVCVCVSLFFSLSPSLPTTSLSRRIVSTIRKEWGLIDPVFPLVNLRCVTRPQVPEGSPVMTPNLMRHPVSHLLSLSQQLPLFLSMRPALARYGSVFLRLNYSNDFHF